MVDYMKDSLAAEIVNKHGRDGLDLVLVVYVNFYESELEIMDLCSKWVARRDDLTEKRYLLHHASDEAVHANLFRQGVERLGLKWDEIPMEKYRISDISERFQKLFDSDDELEVLVGLNLYAEGVLAMEELVQLAEMKPQYFYEFDRIATEEKTHLAFGAKVAKRYIAGSEDDLRRAQSHCDWYRDHLDNYLHNDLADKLQWAIDNKFITSDYQTRCVERFRDVMGRLGLKTH